MISSLVWTISHKISLCFITMPFRLLTAILMFLKF